MLWFWMKLKGIQSSNRLSISTFKESAQVRNQDCCSSLCLQLSLLCGATVCVQNAPPLPLAPNSSPPPHCTLTSWTFVSIVHISHHAKKNPEQGSGSEARKGCPHVLSPPPPSNEHKRIQTPPPDWPLLHMWLPSTGSTSTALGNSTN